MTKRVVRRSIGQVTANKAKQIAALVVKEDTNKIFYNTFEGSKDDLERAYIYSLQALSKI